MMETPSRQNKAPYPAILPGDICTLRYLPEQDAYLLSLDDTDGSTYNLGGNIRVIQQLFTRKWGLGVQQTDRLIDLAHEFRVAILNTVNTGAMPFPHVTTPTRPDPFEQQQRHGQNLLPKHG